MKSKHLLASLLIPILTLGLLGFIKPITNNVVSASDEPLVERHSGFFKKLTSVDEIVDNEKYLLVGGENSTLDYIWGGNYHIWVTSTNLNYYSNQKDIFYLKDEGAQLLTMKKVGSNYALYLENYVDHSDWEAKIKSGYLVHNDGSGQVTPFGGLAVEKVSSFSNSSTWEVTYDGSNMRFVTLDGRLLALHGASGYDPEAFFASTHLEWKSTMNLYKYCGDTGDHSYSNDPIPYRTEYNLEDVLNMHGLYVQFLTDEAVEFNIYYDDAYRFFTYDNYINYEIAGTYKRTFMFVAHDHQFEFYITVKDKVQVTFTLLNNTLVSDPRGTYIAVAENHYVAYYSKDEEYNQKNNGHGIALTDQGFDDYDHVIYEPTYDLINNAYISIKREYSLELHEYVLKAFTSTGSYLSYTNEGESDPGYNTYIRASIEEWQSPTIVDGELHFGEFALRYDDSNNRFLLSTDTSLEACKLYRLDLNLTNFNNMNSWREYNFDEEIRDYCDEDGQTSDFNLNIIREAWGTISPNIYTVEHSFYQDLSADEQSYLASLIYWHDSHPYGSLESMVDCYDYMVNKYDLADFMYRKESGAFQTNYIAASLFNNNVINFSNDIFPIIVISIVSISALSVSIFVLRKKKHN